MKKKSITYLSTLLLLMGGVGTATVSLVDNYNVVSAALSGSTYKSAMNLDFQGQPFTMIPVFDGDANITSDTNGTTAKIKLSDMANSSLQSMTINGIAYTPSNGYLDIPVNSDGSSSDVEVSILIPGTDTPKVFPMQVSIADPQASSTDETPDTNVNTGEQNGSQSGDQNNNQDNDPINIPDINSVDPTNNDQSIDYSYQVLQEDPSAGESVASQFFTGQSTVTKNSDGSYTVSMQMKTPKNFGDNPVEITSINGGSINPDVTTSSDGTSNYMNYSFNISSLDALDNYIPASLKIGVASFGYYASHNVNFKFSQGKSAASATANSSQSDNSAPTLPSYSGSTTNSPTNSSTTGSFPQTGSKKLPIYIMYAGFITLAVAMAGINSMGKFDK